MIPLSAIKNFAVEADKLGNSVITLKRWGDEVIKSVDSTAKDLNK